PLCLTLCVIDENLAMSLEELVKNRLEESAERNKSFWDEVKARFSKKLLENEEKFQLVDIQEISDQQKDLILIRNNKEMGLEQLEVCHIFIEKRLFKKPKLTMHFSSGPFADDFFKQK